MFSPSIVECAKALGVTPDAFAAKVDIAIGTGHSRAEAIATAFLDLADPGFDAYAAICCGSEQAEEDAVCRRNVDIPTPLELTEPEEVYAQSAKNRRLHESRMRLSNSTKGEQLSRMRSQRGPLHDGKEDA